MLQSKQAIARTIFKNIEAAITDTGCNPNRLSRELNIELKRDVLELSCNPNRLSRELTEHATRISAVEELQSKQAIARTSAQQSHTDWGTRCNPNRLSREHTRLGEAETAYYVAIQTGYRENTTAEDFTVSYATGCNPNRLSREHEYCRQTWIFHKPLQSKQAIARTALSIRRSDSR